MLVAKLARYLAVAFVVLLMLSFFVYTVFIHPNDARLDFPPISNFRPIAHFYARQATLLTSHMPHHEDLSDEEYLNRRKDLVAALPDYALPTSRRFASPYQIYVPIGSYPLKLDAQDGVFIPGGASLTVRPGLSGTYSVRFAAAALISGGTLILRKAGGSEIQHWGLAPSPHPNFDASSQLYKNFWRFVRVDPQDYLAHWREVQQDITLAAGDEINFLCEAEHYGCLLGDVGFYTPQAEAPHNILIMLVDTLRADAIHAGNAPRMAALAADSVEFRRALSPGNMTSPSTNAFLSCRRPSQLGEVAFSYGLSGENREDYYANRQPSFPARLFAAGFDTAMIGNVSVISEIYGVGITHGFARQIALETDGYDTPAIARDALTWLAEHGDHRFLLYLHFNAPHAPYRAPLRDIVSSYPGLGFLKSYADTLKWLYQGEVAYTDRYVGQVLAGLKQLGLADTTVVVLTADHGDQHTQHDFRGNTVAPDFSGAYFDHGATLLDDEIHVPLIIHQPGGSPHQIADYVSTLDLGPTLLGLSSAASAAGCAGESLAPYLQLVPAPTPALAARTLASEGFRARAIVFAGRYKYVRTYEPTDKRIYGPETWSSIMTLYMAPEQLFDLATDPSEENDLSAQAPELLDRARALYRQTYSVRTGYELIVETPAEQPLRVDIVGQANLRFEEGTGAIAKVPGGQRVTATSRQRYLLEVHGELPAVPKVTLGGKPAPVLFTSLRLPLNLALYALPVETGGRYTLLDHASETVAYLRKVEDDGEKNRRIQSGNPAFEKVLREWGYLNDK